VLQLSLQLKSVTAVVVCVIWWELRARVSSAHFTQRLFSCCRNDCAKVAELQLHHFCCVPVQRGLAAVEVCAFCCSCSRVDKTMLICFDMRSACACRQFKWSGPSL
jgi:hypothetical protein